MFRISSSNTFFYRFLARSTVRDCCYKNYRQHFVGDQSSTIHVCGYGGANVQGRETFHLNLIFIFSYKFTTPLGISLIS